MTNLLSLPATELAPLLLGARIRRGGREIILTETEAYLPEGDASCHAANLAEIRRAEIAAAAVADPTTFWRVSGMPRSAPMFGPGGMLYVYFTYGMHFCANVVCGGLGEPTAVLLRSALPAQGLAEMAAARGRQVSPRSHEWERLTPETQLREAGSPRYREIRSLTDGPAKLAVALGLTRAENGLMLRDVLELELPAELAPYVTRPRVGIREAADLPLRFVLAAEGSRERR